MNFFPMRLEFQAGVWTSLIEHLRRRGRGNRESGAFLLGQMHGDTRVVQSWVPYEELDSRSLNYAHVRVGTEAFAALWAECSKRQELVVADVHTHPLGPRQSPSDRKNPMISMPGHVALIIPNFAMGTIQPADVSVNVYLGEGQWRSHFRQEARTLIRLSEDSEDGR